MTVTLGEIAGLIAAIAFLLLVFFSAAPLLKLGRSLEELRLAIRDLGHNTVPILVELKSTVSEANNELQKLSYVTEDINRITEQVSVVSEKAAAVATTFNATVGAPMVKTAALFHGFSKATKKHTKKNKGKSNK